MALQMEQMETLLDKGFSRRQLGRIASLLTAGAAALPFTEYAMAQQAEQESNARRGGARRAMSGDMVRISSNENPWGPCKEGLEAIIKVAPHGGYYDSENVNQAFLNAIVDTEGVKPNYVFPCMRVLAICCIASNARIRLPPVAGLWLIQGTEPARRLSSVPSSCWFRCVQITLMT